MKTYSEPIVVFDLDGTLVDTDGFDGTLFCQAVREVIGAVDIDESWQRYRQVTDAGVLQEILEDNALEGSDRLKTRVRKLFADKVESHIGNGGECRAILGARAAIDSLRRHGCKVGIATGGWGHTANMKLAAAAISTDGLVVSTCDDSPDRVEIMTTCLKKLGGTRDRAVYVGDAIWDLEASDRAGWAFIGVGAKLKKKCDGWISDFTDPAWQLLHNESLGRTREK